MENMRKTIAESGEKIRYENYCRPLSPTVPHSAPRSHSGGRWRFGNVRDDGRQWGTEGGDGKGGGRWETVVDGAGQWETVKDGEEGGGRLGTMMDGGGLLMNVRGHIHQKCTVTRHKCAKTA